MGIRVPQANSARRVKSPVRELFAAVSTGHLLRSTILWTCGCRGSIDFASVSLDNRNDHRVPLYNIRCGCTSYGSRAGATEPISAGQAMRLSTAISVVMLAPLFAGASAVAGAQSQKPQIAGIAPPPPAPHPRASGQYHRRGMGHRGSRAVYRVPVRVDAGGRVFANFGYGFEPVLRSCGAQFSAPVNYAPPTYTAPSYAPPVYTPPTFGAHPTTQPAPAQLTESQRMARAAAGATQPQATSNRAATGSVTRHTAACWATQQGQIVVFQP